MCSHPVYVASGTQHSAVPHYPYYGVLTVCLPKDPRVKVWWCKVRTVGWVRQHCLVKWCDTLNGVHPCVCDLALSRRNNNSNIFLLNWTVLKPAYEPSSISLLWSWFVDVPRKELKKNNTFLIPKDCSYNFFYWQYTLDSLHPWGCRVVPFHQLLRGLSFTVVYTA